VAEVFLSYASEDRAKASAIAETLAQSGHDVWWDRKVRGGREYSREIEAALQRADHIVVLWSSSSIASAWVRDEAAEGRDSGRLIPVLVDQVRPPIGFRQFQALDLTTVDENTVQDLLLAIAGEPVSETFHEATESPSGNSGAIVSPEARRALVRGKYLREKETPDALEAAANEFRMAVKLAPAFAEAYAYLADTLGVQARLLFGDWRELFVDAREAAQKAVQLAPELGAALSAAGFIAFTYEWDWSRAEALLRKAITVDPELVIARVHLARLLEIRGQFDEAISVATAALDVAPSSVVASNSLGLALSRSRRFGQAIHQFRTTLELEPLNFPALYHIAWNLAYSGKGEEALEQAEKVLAAADSSFQALGLLGYVHAILGHSNEARACVDELLNRGRDSGQYNAMLVLVALGDNHAALEMLETEYRQRSLALLLLNFDPALDPLRSDPRFSRLVEKLRLPVTKWS
jgi:tetratricopeptide (TPR) repeat protein